MELQKLKPIIEALLCAADGPLTVNHLYDLFTGDLDQPVKDDIRKVLHELVDEYQAKGMEIKQVASGFRLQVNPDYSIWITRLFQQKPPRYSRALLETLALIAYRQPVTRGEIEAIRGVSVSSNMIKTLQEREWVKTLGHKDVPGRPSLYGTTSEFLDYFNLKNLNELPTLSELKDLDQFHPELALNDDALQETVNEPGNTESEADAETTQQNTSESEQAAS
ncbi:MAG: SMC-Scp complex subunit ScpB [Gammaproteobacteria bacterium]|jgi:segregation and condensation protein B|nr:SMC-Scp complex subunit ScpB [Gammaproteobacteria bacterium]MBT4862808.1 SMC-Scp complex subunit ScpB [Gammaproteobacteria bacterium]MBT6701832.1 SMC-Scp complex subunit ScpB [Gammaproteobacteria bacterium]